MAKLSSADEGKEIIPMRPFDSVILTEDLPQHNIPAGTEGNIVDVFSQDDEVYAVELFDRDGTTLDVVA